MTYQWKIPGVIPVEAQKAGEELDRIYRETGSLEPATIVNESRSKNAPLYPCFEWEDEKAAEKYRETQAREIVRAVVTVCGESNQPSEVRAFVHVENSYQPISVVVKSKDKMQELLRTAIRELDAIRKKYNTLEELTPVFEAINSVSTSERRPPNGQPNQFSLHSERTVPARRL